MKIVMGTYESGPWAGWIEDEAKTWITFVRRDGTAVHFGARSATGACL